MFLDATDKLSSLSYTDEIRLYLSMNFCINIRVSFLNQARVYAMAKYGIVS
ncbi:hypothetical protein SAMN03159376_05339 [Pseudomonas sp. NFACC09-4]|nr:hypothetical protein SAMN03159376_05339 [Pseudomonas sp. NFACC09-4]